MRQFSAARRTQARDALVARARSDGKATGAAITGSFAGGKADERPDIDLFLGAVPRRHTDHPVTDVLEAWSAFVHAELGAAHHFDTTSRSAVYRAFLLEDLLEIDLGLTPETDFRPKGPGEFTPPFRAPAERQDQALDPGHLVGHAWCHVLHARIALKRGRLRQAEHRTTALRDNTPALASQRPDLPTVTPKAQTTSPEDIQHAAAKAAPHGIEPDELERASTETTTPTPAPAELSINHPKHAEILAPHLTNTSRAEPT